MLLVTALLWFLWCGGDATRAPDQVWALQGSCVLLPCSSPPGSSGSSRGSSARVDVRLRYSSRSSFLSRMHTAFSTDPKEHVRGDEFKGRVFQSGDLGAGDCSLTIRNIRMDDAHQYEIELRKHGGTWTRFSSIHLTITRFPERPEFSVPPALVLGQTVVLNCSVRISCPSAPPLLRWVWEKGGAEHVVKERVERGGQASTLVSSLTFSSSHLIKPRLRCEALHPGNRRNSTAHTLNVHFPPVDVSVEVRTEGVREGGSALLECVCKADPPVTEYRWSYTHLGRVMPLPPRTPTTRLHNVTRHTHVQCSARNGLGSTTSPLTALNVQYPPVIVRNASGCIWDGQVQECVCTVNSNPHPLITWSVNDSLPPASFNTTLSSTAHTLQETLRGHTHTPLFTTCYTINHLGNDTHVLLHNHQRTEGRFEALIPVGFGVFLLLLLSLLLSLLLCLCRRRAGRRRRRRAVVCGPSVYPDRTGVYQERLPLYINCSEVTNIYTNGSYQLIYQNCTPRFVLTAQTHKRQRRGARRQRRERDRQIPAVHTHTNLTNQTERTFTAESDTAIYVEVI
ncbi:myelin-associated glycoprotein isoform X2 [Trichomycterus rosablanca]|uniref:myelin-associated glycoprotein isoform X2 n=1 Tax=Trichomycterus rosablanca TaxID=2290929 RepID=UPI002F35D4CE